MYAIRSYYAPLVYIISALMLVATTARGLIQAFEINNEFRWLLAGLLILYGILLFSELAIMRRYPFYLKAYFVIQTIIVVVLLVLPFPSDNPETRETTDFYALLFIPLCVQAIFYFRRPISYYWVIFLTASSVTAFVITSYSIHYTKLYEDVCDTKFDPIA